MRRMAWASAAFLLLTVMACARKPLPALVGTVLPERIPAKDFSLTDQKGAVYRLSYAKGKVVVLSFIYTHCTDICPFVALKDKEARDLLGPLASKVEFVAVTTDPDRDTPPVNAAYSKEAGLYDHWHFLTGTTAEVKEVWSAFGVAVHKAEDNQAAPVAGASMEMAGMDDDSTKGLSGSDIDLGKSIGERFGGGYEVTHTAPFWLIDQKGEVRAVLNADALPADIVTDIKVLLAGG